jgi:tetratricopeptide (TPR) repeat protein
MKLNSATWLLAMLSSTLVCVPSFGADLRDQPSRTTESLEQLRNDGDLTRAKTNLLRAALASPNSQPALFNLGALAEREKDWAAAADFYTRAALVSPETDLGRTARTRLEVALRFAKLSASVPGRAQLRYEVALAGAAEARRNGQFAAARATLESLTASTPERWEAPAMLGAVLAEQGQLDEAAASLRAARRNAPAMDRDRFNTAIDALLNPSRHLADATLQGGADRAAATLRLSRETLPARGGERIKEAAALLVSRDLDGAIQVLAGAVSEPGDDALVAWNMLRELSAVSPEAGLILPPEPPKPHAQANLESLLPDPVTAEMREAYAPPPVLVEDRPFQVAENRPLPAPAPAAVPTAPAILACEAPAAPAIAPITITTEPLLVAARVVPSAETAPRSISSADIQVGAYRNQESAAAMARSLATRGFPAEARREQGIYRVIVGPFANTGSALQVREQLAQQGFAALVRARSGN